MTAVSEPLGGGRFVYRTDDCRFGEDALQLAAFAAPKPRDIVCDLGTGTGILPLLFCVNTPPARVDGVERCEPAAALAKRAVEENGLSGNIRIFHLDWNDWKSALPPGGYSLVTCNPPYFPADSGKACKNELRRTARQESSPTMPGDVCAVAAGLLKNGGDFCLCHRPERLTDVLTALRAAGLEPKRLHFLCAEGTSEPWLLLCRAKKGGKAGLSVTFQQGKGARI